MFTLSVVLGSSILYKDFQSSTPERILKFVFGCLSTFIGVYLITSKRHTTQRHSIKARQSIPHLALPIREQVLETAPLMVVGTTNGEEIEDGADGDGGDGMGETPPHLIGTSFGYHFTNSRVILERRSSRSTLPKSNKNVRQKDDISSTIWTRWRTNSGSEETLESPTGEIRPETMGRTQSEIPTTWQQGSQENAGRDSQSEIVDERGRNRGYSVV